MALDVIRRPKTTPAHELERYIRCKDCSEVRGYRYKCSHLVALRLENISTLHPPTHQDAADHTPLLISNLMAPSSRIFSKSD